MIILPALLQFNLRKTPLTKELEMTDACLLVCAPNAMYRNGVYHCALMRGWKVVFICLTNWYRYALAFGDKMLHGFIQMTDLSL